MASFASSFTIQELSGNARRLVLTGRALPRRPMEFSGTMRADITWYPGNPEATVQMLGAGEDPTTVTGKWSTRYIQGSLFALLDGKVLQSAEELADKVDDIRRKGQLVEVAWFSRIRRGYISKFAQNWLYPTDVEWSIEFTWISQGDKTAPAVVSSGGNVSAIRKQIATQAAAAKTVSDTAKKTFPAAAALLGALKDGAAALQGVADKVNETVNKVAQAILPIEDATRRAAAQMDTLIAAVANPLGALASVVPREFVDGIAIARVTAGQALAAHNAVRQGTKVFRDSQYLGAVQRETLLKRIDGQVLMPYIAREGDDLRTVAKMVYGSADDWRKIASFNDLTSSELASGQRIFIPRPKSFGGG